MRFVQVERKGSDPAAAAVLRLHDVQTMTGRKRSSIYEDIAAGRLPRPIRIGPRAVGWLRADIEQWQAGCIAARDAETAARDDAKASKAAA